MRPYKLEGITSSGKPAVVWCCGKCNRTSVDEAHALKCCDYTCETCGASTGHGYCTPCAQSRLAARTQKMYDAAVKVPVAEYAHEMVCTPDDEFVHVADVLEEGHLVWAWAVSELGRPGIWAEDILEGALQDYHEGAIEYFDVPKLQALLDQYMLEQTATGWSSYAQDTERVVVFREEPTKSE